MIATIFSSPTSFPEHRKTVFDQVNYAFDLISLKVDQDVALRRQFFHAQPADSVPSEIIARIAEVGSGTT